MDMVMLPQALFIFYGALVLACGVGLGVVVGRQVRRSTTTPKLEPPDDVRRRIALLEEELDLTRHELQRLLDDRQFMRELRPPRDQAA
jgi:hypothetical protein